jgi:response regulator RpfG family c-di-GMP phosphodiesterase
MPTLFCLDDFTRGLSGAVQLLREGEYQVLAANDNAAALELAASTPLDATILNCHHDKDNSGLVIALSVAATDVAVVMFSGFCGVPCHQLHLADACMQKGESPAMLPALLRAMRCQSGYGFWRPVDSAKRERVAL